jgi:hypothetical protein
LEVGSSTCNIDIWKILQNTKKNIYKLQCLGKGKKRTMLSHANIAIARKNNDIMITT